MDPSIGLNFLPIIETMGIPALIIMGVVFMMKFIDIKNFNYDSIKKLVLHDKKIEDTTKEIQSIETKQTKIIAQIKEHDQVSDAVKVRIQNITNKAAEDIDKIRNMNNIEEVDKYIDNKWNQL